MSRSHECYDCGGHTPQYDDAYCAQCLKARIQKEEKEKQRALEEHQAAIIVLEKLGFHKQAAILRLPVVAPLIK